MIKSYAVIDMGFGDSGKGKTVDWLSRELDDCSFNIRFNGGPQAAHNVVLPDGYHHTFSMFGSGTLSDKKTYLTSDVSIDPISILNEYEHLVQTYFKHDIIERLHINLDCKIVTPYHRALNRFKEHRRGDDKHGSCGMGYGECIDLDLQHPQLTLHYKDLSNVKKFTNKLLRIKNYILEEYPYIEDFKDFKIIEDKFDIMVDIYENLYKKTISVNKAVEKEILLSPDNIFEGAQGILLDQNYGFNPHTTWSTTTSENIRFLYARHKIKFDLETIGVFRAFPTRHGKGPFPSEYHKSDKNMDKILDDHNKLDDWQDHLRVGCLDVIMLKYAMSLCKIDTFVLTHYDKLDDFNTIIIDYKDQSELEADTYNSSFALTTTVNNIKEFTYGSIKREDFVQKLEEILYIPVKMISTGQTHLDIKVKNER